MTDSLRALDSSFTSFMKHRPATVPFYAVRPERDPVRTFVRQSSTDRPLWGLDQIFAFATDLALDRLAELAPTPDARRAVARTRAIGQADSTTAPSLSGLPPSMPLPVSVYPRTAFNTLERSNPAGPP